MESENLCYDIWIEEALRRVIRRALTLATKQGLPGDHHFYITFKTSNEGIDIPSYLRVEHPDEMTIVLQHQFEKLTSDNEGFSVTLRFKGKPEKLVIPYSAITSFADPSVNFGLQLKTSTVDQDEILSAKTKADENVENATDEPTSLGNNNATEDNVPPKTGEVITLDAFRKKRPLN